MTSISSTLPMLSSPRAQMDARISAAVGQGSISATDQTALESALDSIDKSLSSSTSATGASGTSMKDRIDGLIDAQVSSGKLTDDQASELKSFFEQGGPDKAGGAQGPGPVGGPGGPPPPPPSDSDTSSDDSTSSTSATTTSSAADQLAALMAFIDQLRQSMTSTADTYGSTSATKSASSDSSGLVFNGVA